MSRHRLLFSVLFISLFLTTNAYAFLAGYAHRKIITVQKANIDANLADFPVAIVVTNNSALANCQADGDDIRFTDSGDNILPYEEEAWTGGATANVTALWWVQQDLTSASGGEIYMYYENADAADGQNAAGVWDANYSGVFHLNDNAASTIVVDSQGTQNGVAAVNTDTKDTAGYTGIGGGALIFNGSTDQVSVADNTAYTFNNGTDGVDVAYTLEAWVYPDVNNTNTCIMAKWGNVIANWEYQFFSDTVSQGVGIYNFMQSANYIGRNDATVTGTAAWKHMVATYDGSELSTGLNTWLNGAIVDDTFQNLGTYTGMTNTAEPFYIGRRGHAAALFFDGNIDEVRITKGLKRADAWLHFEYHNMSEADNELTWGSEENAPTGAVGQAISVSTNF